MRLSPNFFVLIRDQNRCRGMWVPSSTSASMVIQSEDEDIEERNVGAGGVVSRQRSRDRASPTLLDVVVGTTANKNTTTTSSSVEDDVHVPRRGQRRTERNVGEEEDESHSSHVLCCVWCFCLFRRTARPGRTSIHDYSARLFGGSPILIFFWRFLLLWFR